MHVRIFRHDCTQERVRIEEKAMDMRIARSEALQPQAVLDTHAVFCRYEGLQQDTHTHTYYISTFTHTKTNALCVYKYENINVCIHTCILMVVCRYECNVCLYACICACRYVHTYVCTHMGFGIVKLMF